MPIPSWSPTLERVGGSPLVESGTVLVIGHSPRVTLPEQAGRLERLRERCHGDSCFSIYDARGLLDARRGGAGGRGVGVA